MIDAGKPKFYKYCAPSAIAHDEVSLVLMRNGKITGWVFALVLTAVEQGIKLIINSHGLTADVPILAPVLYFKPMFNRDYSWFNSMLQLGVGKWEHILLVAAMLALICLFYRFLHVKGKTTRFVDTAFAFLISAAACSLVDKIWWGGSLDYILVNGFFTFDLKDVYINIFIGLVVIMFFTNHQGIRAANDGALLKEFIGFLRGKRPEGEHTS